MKKKLTMLFTILVLTLTFAALVPAAISTPHQTIRNACAKKAGSAYKVTRSWYADFDGNGRSEAFLLTTKKTTAVTNETPQTLWFGYISGSSVMLRKLATNILSGCWTMKLKSTRLFVARRYAATSCPESLYRVAGNSVKRIFSGDSIKKVSGNNFTSIHSTYDAYKSGGIFTGHTYKPYYYYYKSGAVYQYNAAKISYATFKKLYSNVSYMVKKYKSKGTIISILKRNNNLVHVNYRKSDGYGERYSYVTFKLNGNKLVTKSTGEGTYLTKK